MNTEHDSKPTVIDLDPDQVIDADKPQAEAKPAVPPQGRRSGMALPVFAALLVGSVGGGWLYRDLLSAYLPPDKVKQLQERVDVMGMAHEQVGTQLQAIDRLSAQLKSDVDALESAQSAAIALDKSTLGAVNSLTARLDAMDQAQAALRKDLELLAARPAVTTEGTPLSAVLPPDVIPRLEALEKDMASLKTQEPGRADATALTQTLADLKAKIDSGVPFADEQARLARMVPAAAGLDVLARHAAMGLPAALGLATELKALKPGLPVPQIPAPSTEPGILDRMLEQLSSVITIRDLDAPDWQVVAEKAIAFAEAGDLPQAVAAVDSVEAAMPPTLQQWRDRATARIELESALAAVSDSVARDLAARN